MPSPKTTPARRLLPTSRVYTMSETPMGCTPMERHGAPTPKRLQTVSKLRRDRYLINRSASSRSALHPVVQSFPHWSYAMTDDQDATDDPPDPTRVPPELEHLIAGLPAKTCFPA